MSAADCRAGRCGCAKQAVALPASARAVKQTVQFGRIDPKGRYRWERGQHTFRVSSGWAAHIESLRSAHEIPREDGAISRTDGWLVYRDIPTVPGAIARIRWDAL